MPTLNEQYGHINAARQFTKYLPIWKSVTCRFSKFNNEAIVNSPNTKAIAITAPFMIPDLIVGIITCAISLAVPAPSVLAAS